MPEPTYRLDRDIDIAAWLGLYHASDWNREWTVTNAQVMLVDAYLIVTAWSGTDMVGTLTVLSDGCNYATIDDVVVHPEHRRRGIGARLVGLAVERVAHLEPHLMAIPGVAPFYAKLGFVAEQGTTGMYWPRHPGALRGSDR